MPFYTLTGVVTIYQLLVIPERGYPAGATVLVHYHPGNPKIAVLETGATWFIFLWVSVGGLCTACGLVGLMRTINARRIYMTAENEIA
jgi:hypothetical protein